MTNDPITIAKHFSEHFMQYGLQPFCAFDSKGRITLCNEVFCSLTGYTQQALLAMSYLELFPEELQIIEQVILDSVTDTGKPLRYESVYLHAAGSRIPVEVMLHQITHEEYCYAFVIDISERKHDALTGLYKRTYFEYELRRFVQQRQPGYSRVGIIVSDIDGLTYTNDSLGYEKGDEILIQAAQLFSAPFGHGELVARVGGDEFAVFLPYQSMANVAKKCDYIRRQIDLYNVNNIELPISMSLGYAFSDDPTKDWAELLRDADTHMYREKLQHTFSPRTMVVYTLMKALEARDFITDGHTDRLQELVTSLGQYIGISGPRIVDLQLLAQFHDVGKIGTPDHILFKPGTLNHEEYLEMKRHCEIGHQIAQSAPPLAPIADWILHHHECWDGSGYPQNKKGEDIPIECRILSITDAYDAMTSGRPYRQAMSRDDALEELSRCSGSQFDPALVSGFLNIV